MKFLFIRHAETDRDPSVPIPQWGLDESGIARAKELSHRSDIKNLKVLYSSLQTKALETAVFLGKPNATPIKTEDGLTEISSFTGSYEKSQEKYSRNVAEYYNGSIERIKGGETKSEALARFIKTLDSIYQVESSVSTVGIVTHGNILALFSEHYTDVDSYKLHTAIQKPDTALFDWTTKKFDTFFNGFVL